MALCLANSLIETNGFDPKDQMDRYCRWWKEGYLSSNGRCFDIGRTVSEALRRYARTGDPIAGSADPHAAGKGSIMRLAPVPMFYYPDIAAAVQYSAESSRTTHGTAECIDACRLLSGMICRALSGESKEEILLGEAKSFHGEPKIMAIARGEYRNKSISEIRGTGYVVESLEAALWCFLHTDTFEAAILKAANLGDDADTTAAICGQVAGAFYGESGIPQKWLERLVMREEILKLADRLYVSEPTQQLP
jgi:ADP-ribosyl-[dinitrogen reductase] hydrolase